MENKKELVYSPASFGKRIGAFFIDALLLLLAAMTFFSLINMAAQEMPFSKENYQTRTNIQNESGLYVEGTLLSSYVTTDEANLSSYREKKDFLSDRLEKFYASDSFFPDTSKYNEYSTRRLEYKYEGLNLFIENDGKVEEVSANPQYFYDFYVVEVENYALPCLYSNKDYANTTIVSLLSMIVEFIISITISAIIFYLVLPLTIFKRGRQTLGKKLLKISLISVKAVNLKTSNYILRFIFIYFIYIVLGFFSFLLPEILSLAMLAFSKRRQDLVDYVFNHYQVDSKDKEIYLDLADYDLHMRAKDKAKLENKDLELTNNRNGDLL